MEILPGSNAEMQKTEMVEESTKNGFHVPLLGHGGTLGHPGSGYLEFAV